MAKFKICTVRDGVVGKEKVFLAVTSLSLDEGETEMIFPESAGGETVTHIAFEERHYEAEYRDHDWHHPAQGGDYYPERYEAWPVELDIPESVTRIRIPKTVQRVGYLAFRRAKDRSIIEIDPENPYIIMREDGYICEK